MGFMRRLILLSCLHIKFIKIWSQEVISLAWTSSGFRAGLLAILTFVFTWYRGLQCNHGNHRNHKDENDSRG